MIQLILIGVAAALLCAFCIVCIYYLRKTWAEARRNKSKIGTLENEIKGLNENLVNQLKAVELKLSEDIVATQHMTVVTYQDAASDNETSTGSYEENSEDDAFKEPFSDDNEAFAADDTEAIEGIEEIDEIEIEEIDLDEILNDELLERDSEQIYKDSLLAMANLAPQKPQFSRQRVARDTIEIEEQPTQSYRSDRYSSYELELEEPRQEEQRIEEMQANHMGYDVGRSGKKYTARELEQLIK